MLTNQDNTNQPASSNEGSAVVNTTVTENTQPTLFAGKYKTAEDLERGYNESGKYIRDLTTKVKDYETKIPKAPENCAFDFSQDQDLKDLNLAEDEQVKKMLPIFKELNISQEQANKLVSEFIRTSLVPAPTPEDFKKALGSEADVKIGRLQLFNSNLPPKDQEVFKRLAENPESVEFLYRYILPKEDATVPVGGNTVASGKSAAQLYEEAFSYRDEKTKNSLFFSDEQTIYTQMLEAASAAKIREEKNLKK